MMSDFCMPAKVYVVIAIIGIILSIPNNFQLGIANVVLSNYYQLHHHVIMLRCELIQHMQLG